MISNIIENFNDYLMKPFPSLFFWLGEEADSFDWETYEDYEAWKEHQEMTALGY